MPGQHIPFIQVVYVLVPWKASVFLKQKWNFFKTSTWCRWRREEQLPYPFWTKHFWGNKKQKKNLAVKNEKQPTTPHQTREQNDCRNLKLQHPHPPTSQRVRCFGQPRHNKKRDAQRETSRETDSSFWEVGGKTLQKKKQQNRGHSIWPNGIFHLQV